MTLNEEDFGKAFVSMLMRNIGHCLGLTDTCPELEQFPKLANITPGVFRYPADSGSTPDTGNDADGGGEVGDEPDSAQAWPGAVAV